MNDAGSSGYLFLAGETVESWRALSLRGLWTVEDTKRFLKSGQNCYATASGNMADEIMHSMQHVSDDDLLAIASYLKSLPPGPQNKTAGLAPKAVVARVLDDLFSARGGLGYIQFCGDCHRADGGGVNKIFPPTAGNPTVSAKDAATLVHIILTGGQTAATAIHPRVFTMPAFARLADMLLASNAQQLVRGMCLHLETKGLLPGNVGNQINGCFRRSMNGKPLAKDSADMKAMVAYFDWMKGETKPEDKVAGRGVGKIDRSIKPDSDNGKKIYADQCALCHGENGEGLRNAAGKMVYPPLWGDDSFNIGAGMARTYTAAAFVKRNMPIGFHANFPLGQGGLSDQEAVDVGEYFSHQPRPDFPDKVKDWPKDPKPSDARY